MTVFEVLLARAQDSVVLTLLLITISYALYALLSPPGGRLPASLPWVGTDKGTFLGRTRATYSGLSKTRQRLSDGYEKYTKNDKSYVFPNFMSRPTVVIPLSSRSWLLDQPDSVLSLTEAHNDILEAEYAFTDKRISADPYHEHVIHKHLTRRFGELVGETWEEIVVAMDEIWGMDETTSKEIGVYDSVIKLVGRVSNRMFVGQPVCRNQEYLDACVGFAQQIILVAQFMQVLPRILRPVIGPLAAQFGKFYWRKAAKYTIPIIEDVASGISRKREDSGFEWEEPNTYITWHIRSAQKEGKAAEVSPDRISRRLMVLNFAAIHTTTMTLTNVLFDIFSTNPAQGVVEGIHEEVTRVYAECNGVWNKAAIAKLIRVDSAIRESMRVSGFFTTGLVHKVTAKDGVYNDKEGYRLPYGSHIGMDQRIPMRDATNYPDADTYDAFRFSRQRETYDALRADQRDSARELELRQLSMVTTGHLHTGFGHGKHACPGRFFVAQEMKMIVAYVVMNYDVEILRERPNNVWLGHIMLPPMKAGLRVKRRARSMAT